ncbi:MAG: sigma-E factor negative regulatory protein [Rhodanobacteraceae bacterium]|nr:sigma-E factor negative regulatory protein [Rhodanobacteraceae bacterium]
MTTEIKQQLSALMDGEIERDAARFVLRAVETDSALAKDWSRFHLVRDCLQGRQVLVADAGFAAAVMARIDAEAAPAQARGSRWVRYLSGGAVAAAVAVVALMASAPEPELQQQPGLIATRADKPAPVRAPTFNDSSLSPRLPLAQPASATVGSETLFAPGYDLRSQPLNGWRPVESNYHLRTPPAPYVLLIVPVQQPAGAEQKQPQRLQ